jgi:type I restriction enzyme S subunit
MRDGWQHVSLGDVFTLDNRRIGAHATEPRILSLSKYDGVVLASDYFDRRVASASLDGYKVLPVGSWAYSTIHIDEGSIARNHLADGVLSPMYTTLRWYSDQNEAAYFELLLRSPWMLDEYRSRAKGTVNRRRSLAFDAFSRIEVAVPPIDQQRRIVDLVEAIESLRLHAEEQRSRALEFRDAVIEMELGPHRDLPAVALSDFADVTGGLTKDQKREAQDGLIEVPYLRVANVQRGHLDLSDLTEIRVEREKAERLRLLTGDVLFNEGGDRDKLGRGWVWEGQVSFCIHQNHVLRARIRDTTFDPYFVSIWGNSAFGRRWFEVNGAQTTNLASVSLSTLKRFPVPCVPHAEQRRIVELSEASGRAASVASKVAARAGVLRAAMAKDLLSGAHWIPASYDRFLNGAA